MCKDVAMVLIALVTGRSFSSDVGLLQALHHLNILDTNEVGGTPNNQSHVHTVSNDISPFYASKGCHDVSPYTRRHPVGKFLFFCKGLFAKLERASQRREQGEIFLSHQDAFEVELKERVKGTKEKLPLKRIPRPLRCRSMVLYSSNVDAFLLMKSHILSLNRS